MDNYTAIVFDTDEKAFEGLHALWNLDATGDITVHGAAVIHRDEFGHVDVATKDTDPGVRTIVGAGLGALLGALAGPVGAAAGIAGAASIAAGTAAGIGAAAGGVAGLTADAVKAGEHEEAAFESGFVMKPGQAAVIAEISEDWTTPVDTAAKNLGGKVYRREKSAVRESSFFGDDYSDYLYPYDYDPHFYAS
jgi:uncharacterized membrane protein